MTDIAKLQVLKIEESKRRKYAEELAIIEAFVRRVNERAEQNMLKTHKLEGSHYAAMTKELELLREKATRK